MRSEAHRMSKQDAPDDDFNDVKVSRVPGADRRHEAASPTERIAADRNGLSRLASGSDELIDRMGKLRTLVAAFAQETAAVRREAARLRSQNARLQRRVVELETRLEIARELTSREV
jgi:X-X-X-Leu-X-X-Gly heptad repeat protein